MRVLHVVHNCQPDVTGAAVRTSYIVKTQVRLGVRASVVSSPFQAPQDPAQGQGIEFFGTIPHYRCYNGADAERFMAVKPLWERAMKLTMLPVFVRRICEAARAEGASVIHAHNLFFCGLAAEAAGRRLGVPVIYEIRSLPEEGIEHAGPVLPRAYRLLDRLVCRSASHVIVLCDGLRDEFIRRGVPEEKITVAGNGAEVSDQEPVRLPGNELFTIGYIGTLAAYEGLDLLMHAVGLLASRQPRLRVLIVGDGPARPTLEQHVDHLGLRSVVRFAGRVAHDRTGSYYDSIDLFVCPRRPSRITDLVTPLKPLEIMARGKPLLAGDCGGHRELIRDGVNGALFRDFNPSALAGRIEQMMNDPEGLARLGRQARQWVGEHRSWESQCRPVIDLYRRLIAERGRRKVLLVAPAPGAVVTGGVENGVGMILRSRLATRHRIRVWDRRKLHGFEQVWDFARFMVSLAHSRPQVVHIKSSSGINFVESAMYATIARMLGRRVLLQLHSGEFEAWYAGCGVMGQWAIRRMLQAPSRVLVLSEHWRRVVERLVPGQSVSVVPNGVEIGETPAPRPRRKELLRVLTIGTLGSHKGHFEILRAAGLVRDEQVCFLLAGPDETTGRGEGGEVRRFAAESDLDGRVEFLGSVGPARKRELLSQADIFLLPSRAEGMPNAVLEAMAAGLPVIATPVGSLPEMFEGAPGVRFVRPGDASDLAEAILELLRDPERRALMGRSNRARVEKRYSFACVEQLLDALYRGEEA